MTKFDTVRDLTFTFDPSEDGIGKFSVALHCDGFAGYGSCFIEASRLSKAARDFAAYPLPSDERVCIEGGYFFDNSSTLEQTHVHISAHPASHLGDLAVRITLAVPFDAGVSEFQSQLTCLLPFTYEQLKSLSQILDSLANRHRSNYLLEF